MACDRTTFAGGAGNPVNCDWTDTGNGLIRLSPTGLNFNTTQVGTTGTGQTVLIKNNGTGPLTISSVTITGASAARFVLTAGGCAGAYNVLEQCSVLVQFAPTTLGVIETANLTVNWVNSLDMSAQTTQTTLTGEGTASPSLPGITIAPSSLTFASQPANTLSVAQSITVTNNGTAGVNVTGITATGPFVTANTAACIGSYAPNATCTFQATFNPTAGGIFSGGVTISLTDPVTSLTATPSVSLSGTAVVPVVQTTFPRIAVSPSSLDFGELYYGRTSAAQIVTVTNTGDASLTLGGTVRLRDFTVDLAQCQFPIVPGGSCNVLVTFTPTKAGARSDGTQISSNAVSGDASLRLSGVGGGGVNGAAAYSANNAGAGSGKPRGEVVKLLRCSGGGDDDNIPGCDGYCTKHPHNCSDGKPNPFCIAHPGACNPIVTPRLPPPPPPPPPEDIIPREDIFPVDSSSPSTNPSGPCTAGGGSNTGPAPTYEPNVIAESDDIGSDLRDIYTLSALDPINTAIGNKYHTQNDYKTFVLDGVGFTRMYNGMVFASVSKNEQYFGPGWRGSRDSTLAFSADGKTATVALPGGGEYVLNKVSPELWRTEGNDGAVISLRLNANNLETEWVFKSAVNEQFVYDASGRLVETTSPRNRTTQLAYTNTGFLSTVKDSSGGTIAFGYDAMGRVAELIDPSGGRTTYSYDVKDRLIHVRYPDGRQRGYRYEHPDFAFALTAIYDGNNNLYVTFKYDDLGRAVSSEFAGKVGGGTVEYVSPLQSITTDAIGTKYERNFTFIDGIAALTKLVVSCDGCTSQTTTFEYDAAGRQTAIVDARGQRQEMIYNSDGKLIRRTFGAGTSHATTQTFEWHSTLSKLLSSTANGITTQFVYNASGSLIEHRTITDGVTRALYYTYDGEGNITQVKSNRQDADDATTTEYNAQGLVTKRTNALGQTQSWSDFTQQGQPQMFIDENGRNTQVRYDQGGRVITATSLGNVTTYFYDANGKLSTTINPDNTTTHLIYDAAHRVIGRDSSNGEKMRYTLDAMSRVTRTESFDPTGAIAQVSTQSFDGFNRLTQSVDGVGNVTQYDYDVNGNLTKTTDAQGNSTKIEYDSINRPVLFIDPRGGTTQSRYDAQGNVSAITDPNGNTTSYNYNGFGEITQTQSPNTGISTQTYNNAGFVVSSTKANLKTMTHSYDALGRITKVVLHNASSQIRYQYDVATNGVGRLATVSDPSGSTSYTYDENGRTASTTVTIGSSNNDASASVTKTTKYIRDALGRVRSIAYPSGKVLSMDYTQGRVTGMTLDGLPLVNDIRYFPTCGAESWVYPLSNGQTKTYLRQLDDAGRVSGYSLSTSIRKLIYDSAARVIRIDDVTNGGATTASQHYGYDANNRLIDFSGFTSQGLENQSFTYDKNGNRLTSLLNGKHNRYFYVLGTNKLVNSIGGEARNFAYDETGSLVSDGFRNFAYDARNRLSAVALLAPSATSSQRQTHYKTNSVGLRVAKQNIDDEKYFVYNEAGKMLGEYRSNGSTIREYFWLGATMVATVGAPINSIQNGQINIGYVFSDQIGAPREVIESGAGDLVWKWDSLPFGESVVNKTSSSKAILFNHRLPGQYFDVETGIHQNWHREYDPSLGRYMTSDPIGISGGLNTYAYVHGNPQSYADPHGLYWQYCSNFGNLYYVDNITGSRVLQQTGAIAGNGAGTNNAGMQCVRDTGPPPTGTYTLGPAFTHPIWGQSMALQPRPGQPMCDRRGFYIHDYAGSIGCIQLDTQVLTWIASSSDREFRVSGTCN